MKAGRSPLRSLLLAILVIAGGSAVRGSAAVEASGWASLHGVDRQELVASTQPVLLDATDFSALFHVSRDGGSATNGGGTLRLGHPLRPRATAGTAAESRSQAAERIRRARAADIRAAGTGLPTFHAGPPPPLS